MMDNPINNSAFQKQIEADRNQAMKFGGAVYTGGIVAATIIFLSFVMTAFPDTAYFIRGLMVLAGIAVGASGLAFPVALHKWAIGGWHRSITIALYYGEMFILTLNTIVSFAALLFKFAGNVLPDWVSWYEPFTILSLAYVIFSWGTIFISDPHSTAKNKEKEAIQQIFIDTADNMRLFINSEAGKRATQDLATDKLREIFNTGSRNPFDLLGSPCAHCGTSNPTGTRFCSQCGASQGTQTPQSPAALPAPRPALSPSSFVPSLPIRPRWTLDGLLSHLGMSRDKLRELIRQYQLFDARSAYNALAQSGYMPESLTIDEFMYLFCEFAGVDAPTWNPIPTAFNPGIHPSSDWDAPSTRPAVAYYTDREAFKKRQEEELRAAEERAQARRENGKVKNP